jgi:hypothetical protein
METFSTRGLKALFTYPFRKRGWEKKMVILAAFNLGGLIIPLFPTLFALGYTAELIRRAVREDDPDLPEWDHWNDLLVDGLRLLGISLVFLVPLAFIYSCGIGTYFATMIGVISQDTHSSSPSWLPIPLLGGFSVMMCSMICSVLFSLVAGFFVPAAATHTVVKRSFGAFLRFNEWWRILRANLGGYIIFFILMGGLIYIWSMIYSLVAWTFVLLPFAFLLPFLITPYLSAICAILFGRIYREAEETLALVEDKTVVQSGQADGEPVL